MKRIFLAIQVLFVAALCYAQPKIEWEKEIHNFGAFDEDLGVVSCNFVYRNTGTEPLVVTAVRANCGCTTPRYHETPLMPGDTASILVKYDASGRPGRFSKNIYVDTNTDPERTTLTIKGVVIGASNTVKSRFPVDMGILKARSGAVMLGTVRKGHVNTEFLDCYNRSNDTIYPIVRDVPKYMDVRIFPQAVPPGEQVTFNFYLNSDKCREWGIVTDSVTIIPNVKAGDADAYRMPFVAIIEDDFSKLTPGERAKAPHAALSEKSADFGNILKAEEVQTRTIKLCNTGKSVMQIRRVYTVDSGITVSCEKSSLKPGKCCDIKIEVDPAQLKGALLNGRVTIITNDPDAPLQTIRAVGY